MTSIEPMETGSVHLADSARQRGEDSLTPGHLEPDHSSPARSTRRSASSDSETAAEFFAAALLQECELLTRAPRSTPSLETLEADPETDELTLVMARPRVFTRKRSIALSSRAENAALRSNRTTGSRGGPVPEFRLLSSRKLKICGVRIRMPTRHWCTRLQCGRTGNSQLGS